MLLGKLNKNRLSRALAALIVPKSRRGLTPSAVDTRLILNIRWLALLGQLTALLFTFLVLDLQIPIALSLFVIGLSVALNVWQTRRIMTDQGQPDQSYTALVFDVVQLTALLFLTGGLLNPFAVLLLAPVVVSAAILRRRQTFMLIALVTGCVTFLAFFNFPLPWDALDMRRSGLYVDGLWMAMVLATVFIGIYAWWVASRARRLDEALAETRFILAKEQEAVALGTLATAAAHRLGSPLNTISVIGHELSRETAPDDPIYEDVVLLCAEIERCRVILSELDDYRNAEPIDVENNIPLSVLIDEIHNTRLDVGNIRFKVIFDERSAMPIPFASRRPEIIQALEDLLRNAGEFAKSEVLITIRCTVDDVLITISDDGPGFSLGVLAKIGTPWNSSRLGTDAHRGLGIFIASTLIETLGGSILYGNGTNGGGEVNLKLPLEILRP